MVLALIIIFTLLGSIFSLGFASLLLLFKKKQIKTISTVLIPYAIGTLLGAAFLGMIPQACQQLSSDRVFPFVLFGFLLFFMLEKFALWRHCHEESCSVHTQAGSLILFGDSLHNFVDGIVIVVAFTSSLSIGITTSVAIIAHEIPQEIGDFTILLDSGFTKGRALFFNAISSLTALAGAIIAYFLLPLLLSLVPYLLAISAASFIYVALADLIPSHRTTGGLKSLLWEFPLIALGVWTITLLQHV
ncbi:MAG: ZIP family metal transporter [Acidobacteriota bacterium]